jgi:hypothetical protein
MPVFLNSWAADQHKSAANFYLSEKLLLPEVFSLLKLFEKVTE